MQIDTSNQQASSPESFEVQMHCPKCLKLYSVPLNEMNDIETRFNCRACGTVFSISLREALESNNVIMGQAVAAEEPASSPEMSAFDNPSSIANQVDVGDVSSNIHTRTEPPIDAKLIFTCPKCAQPYAAGESECSHCGVVFMKFSEREKKSALHAKEDSFQASSEVRQAWDDVLENYENYDMHRQFIGAAWADRSLDYAAHKYATILEVMPADELATKAQKEINALTMVRFEVSTETEVSDGTWGQWMHWMNTFRENVFSLKRLKITNVIMVACGVIIILGLAMPHMRNLIGFGTSILVFVAALRFYFRVI